MTNLFHRNRKKVFFSVTSRIYALFPKHILIPNCATGCGTIGQQQEQGGRRICAVR